MNRQRLRECIEIAIRIRDNCSTVEEKDALADLINFVEDYGR